MRALRPKEALRLVFGESYLCLSTPRHVLHLCVERGLPLRPKADVNVETHGAFRHVAVGDAEVAQHLKNRKNKNKNTIEMKSTEKQNHTINITNSSTQTNIETHTYMEK